MKLDRISPLLDQAIHYKCQNAKMQRRYRKKKMIDRFQLLDIQNIYIEPYLVVSLTEAL